MKAMIFAAGLGTRLKPFTLEHPKALVPVGGIPMLERVIRNLADAGISEIVVNTHHFAPQIVTFLRGHGNFGLDIKISDESECLLDTGGGLLNARPLFAEWDSNEPILLHNADVLTDVPIREMLDSHMGSGADVTLLCSHRNSSRTLYFDKSNGQLLGWENIKTGERKPVGFTPGGNADASPFGGLHIINPDTFFPLLEKYADDISIEGDVSSLPFSIIPFYLAEIGCLDIRRFLLPDGCKWFDVGSTEKLAAAESSLM